MAKLLRCRDAGQDCDFEVCGKTEEEVIAKGTEHAREVHHRLDLSPLEVERIRGVVQEVDRCPQRSKYML